MSSSIKMEHRKSIRDSPWLPGKLSDKLSDICQLCQLCTSLSRSCNASSFVFGWCNKLGSAPDYLFPVPLFSFNLFSIDLLIVVSGLHCGAHKPPLILLGAVS